MQQSQAVQTTALTSVDRISPGGLAPALVERWSSFTPTTREKVVDILLKRADRTRELLNGMERGVVQRRDLSLMQMVALRQHSDTNVQKRAIQLIGAVAQSNRDEVVRRFHPALDLRGDSERGKLVFEERCHSCHRLGNIGFAVGPDLAGVDRGGKEKLLINILDPNREVQSNYFSYVVETRDGESSTGLIANEDSNSVTVRQPLGIETIVPRARIGNVQASRQSLMPEGLEEGLTLQDLADLIHFISANAR